MKAIIQTTLSALANAGNSGLLDLPLTEDLYPEEILRAATAAFSSTCRIERVMEERGPRLHLCVCSSVSGEAGQVLGEILNFLLSHAVGALLQKESC
jgi:hypothetical protein